MPLSARSEAYLLRLTLDNLENKLLDAAPDLPAGEVERLDRALRRGRFRLRRLEAQAEREEREALSSKTQRLGRLIVKSHATLPPDVLAEAIDAYYDARLAEDDEAARPTITRRRRNEPWTVCNDCGGWLDQHGRHVR